jgi:hypothetical protein
MSDTITASELERVAGREQMTLRVFSLVEITPAPPPDEGDEGADPKLGPGTRYLLERRRDRFRLPAALAEALAPLVAGELVETHRASARAGELVATISHLVPRGAARQYRAALADAAPRVPSLRVAASGPWPPYAFTSAGLDPEAP